jgi:hypothetical protein
VSVQRSQRLITRCTGQSISVVTNIEGRGTILLKWKTGEHKTLEGVYLIPQLTANIVSLGQLEEDGHKIVLHAGYLRIWNQCGHMVVKVQ